MLATIAYPPAAISPAVNTHPTWSQEIARNLSSEMGHHSIGLKQHLGIQKDGNTASIQLVVLSDFIYDLLVRVMVSVGHVQSAEEVE